jgi:hypothetical protein
MNYKTAQILRGAETIKKNSMTTDTPRTDAVLSKFSSYDDVVNLARDLELELRELRDTLASVRNFLAEAIHNEGFSEDEAISHIYGNGPINFPKGFGTNNKAHDNKEENTSTSQE